MDKSNGKSALAGDFCTPSIDEAVQWVSDNKGLIVEKAIEYANYVPYDVDDYVQDAYHAAVEASIVCQKNPKLKFGAAFWTVFRRFVAKVTPLPDQAREDLKKKKLPPQKESETTAESTEETAAVSKTYYSGGTSMSFSQSARAYPRLEKFRSTGSTKRKEVDLEKLVDRVKHLWSPRETTAMELALGLTHEGCLSVSEIAAKMGVGKYTAREYLGRAISKVEKKTASVIVMADHRPVEKNVDGVCVMADVGEMLKARS